jgi:hypothetical protein
MPDPRESRDELLQSAAEAGDPNAPEAAHYARLFAALRQLESPRPPSNFAVLTAEAAARRSQDRFERVEAFAVRVAFVALIALALAAPVALAWLLREQVLRLLPAAWPMLLATAGGVLALAVLDRLQPGAERRTRK